MRSLCSRPRDYRVPGAILAPRLGMEGTMIKVDKYLARLEGGDRVAVFISVLAIIKDDVNR